MRRTMRRWLTCSMALLTLGAEAVAEDLKPLLDPILQVGPEGTGNEAASAAWKKLAQLDAERLPDVLAALEGANPLASNWLRAAVDAIAERRLADREALPVDALERFVRDRSNDARARAIAFAWLARGDESAPDRLIPGMADDPSIELRRLAVERLIAEADKRYAGEQLQSEKTYREALVAARDPDQVKHVVERLRKMGQSVDLPKHFGFLADWKLIGPFDNVDKKGFDVAYPPESAIDVEVVHQGQKGPVRWSDHSTDDDYGMVDLTKALDKHKGAVAYATAEFVSDRERQVELRLGCVTAFKVWLNGALLFARDEYHRGTRMDQYRFPATMKPGRNVILLKVCQNEQTQDWAQRWQFQIRVCDQTGTAVLSTTRDARQAARSRQPR